ncbi:MAG TPA: lipid A biosynthesis acyltransferase [Xanthomonadales bacterium]|nr:lipid A biosynthesis acyltransferase [Xanthomonadales bacterium]
MAATTRMPLNVRLLAIALRLGARLPLRVLHAIGGAIGRLPALLRTREWRVARKNAELCFPALDADEKSRFVREALAETGRSLAELALVWSDAPRALAQIREVRGLEHMDAARAAGRGTIVAAPHLGAWELLNLYLSTLGPLTFLYRVPQRPEYETLLVGARTALGAEAVRAEGPSVRVLFKRLAANRLVGILPDQRPKAGEGVDAPFFGHDVRTMTLLSRLAERTGAAVVFGFAERLPRGAGYVLHFMPAPAGIADADAVAAAAALNRAIEHCIARAPTQYQWTYKRFSYREPGSGPDKVYG